MIKLRVHREARNVIIRWISTAWVAVLIGLLCNGQSAQADPTQEFKFGAGTHLGTISAPTESGDSDAHALEGIGANSFRDDLRWPTFSQESATFLWTNRLRELRVLLTEARGREVPLLVLDSGSPDPRYQFPTRQIDLDRFANFAVTASLATRSFDPIFELWNEWDTSTADGPGISAATPQQYVALAKSVYAAVHKSNTASILLVGAAGERTGDWTATTAIIRDGVLRYGDGLSVHLYNYCRPRSDAEELYGRLVSLHKTMIGLHVDPKKKIFITEFGWPTVNFTCPMKSAVTRGDEIGRFLFLVSQSPWIGGAWVYDLVGARPLIPARGASFGLFDANYVPTNSTCATAAASSIIRGNAPTGLEEIRPGLMRAEYDSVRGHVTVLWVRDASGPYEVRWNRQGNTAAYICGEQALPSGWVSLTGHPLVILGRAANNIALAIRAH